MDYLQDSLDVIGDRQHARQSGGDDMECSGIGCSLVQLKLVLAILEYLVTRLCRQSHRLCGVACIQLSQQASEHGNS